MTRPQELVTIELRIADSGVTDVDVTDYVKAVSWSRGRDRETDDYQPTSGTLVLIDPDRRFDPNNDSGPYAGGLTPLRVIRIEYDAGAMFYGWVTNWKIDYARGDTLAYVTVTFTDALGVIGAHELDETAPTDGGDLSGERVAAVLTDFFISVDADAGLSTLGETTYGQNALAYVQQCARAEGGYLFAKNNSVVRFADRHTILNVEATYEFSDVPGGSDGIPYRRLTQASTADLLYNRATGTSETTGNDQLSEDATSIDEYGPRTLSFGLLFNETDIEVSDLLEWHVQRFKDPEARFAEIELLVDALSMSGSPSEVDTLAYMELATVITVRRTPLGEGSTIERTCIVDRIEHSITSNPSEWTVRLSLSNADTRPFLVLDDPVFGKLDSNRLAF